MADKKHLLTTNQMARFATDGFLRFDELVPADLNRRALAAMQDRERANVRAEAGSPLGEAWPELDIQDAYAIQQRNIERRIDDGAALRGHKVGLSSRAMQEMMGIDECDYGHLLDDMFVFDRDKDRVHPKKKKKR